MNLVERAKAILQTPKTEWPVIEGETDSAGYLFVHYVALLALIPPVSAFVGMSMTGYVGYRVGLLHGLVWAVVAYILSLANVYITAVIIDALAGKFGASKNSAQAMKVAIYAPTAAWAAGIFSVQPPIAFLSFTGLYSFYLLYTGLAALMKPPADKVLGYTIATSICVALVWLVIIGVPALVFGLHLLG
jgi:hypothetical protein